MKKKKLKKKEKNKRKRSKAKKEVKQKKEKVKKKTAKSAKQKTKKAKKTNKKLTVKKHKIKKLSSNIIRKPIIKKEKPAERIKSGIEKLDKLILGGFPFGSINLVVGGTGSGKTIFAMDFLMEGVKKGEKVLYITFEESKEEFFQNMEKFGWNLEKLENAGKFIFLEYSPEKVKMMLDEGGGAVESIILKEKIKRMVIDSISSFSLLFETEQEKRQAILALFDLIRKWDVTTLLTLQKNPVESKEASIPAIEYEADSLILLYFLRVKNQRKRFIEILKMRGTKHSKEIYEFEIKNGIKIGKKTNLELG